jgi:hypothetical protein
MRCLMCHAEMILIKAAPEESAGTPGFERHTYQCVNCGDVEERLAFSSRAIGQRATDVPPHQAPSVSPDLLKEPERPDVRALWERAFAKMRGRPSG